MQVFNHLRSKTLHWRWGSSYLCGISTKCNGEAHVPYLLQLRKL